MNVPVRGWGERAASWRPSEGWTRVLTVDAHTEGEPLRVIVAGFPEPEGDTMLAKRRYARRYLDELRCALMWEPRGHADMYGCLLVPPVTERADVGVLFMHNEGFSTMCGHGIIGVATVMVELGLVGGSSEGREPRGVNGGRRGDRTGRDVSVGIDTPAGFVRALARLVEEGDGRRVDSVRFTNVPSFAAGLDQSVEVPGVGRVAYDLAYGGAFYAYVEAQSLGLSLVPDEHDRIVYLGRRIKAAVQAAAPPAHPAHPEAEDLGFLYGTIFVGPAHGAAAHSRNVCVFADGELDRSPTGTGVSGRLAIHRARGELAAGETIRIESLLGTTFDARVLGDTRVGPYDAVVPEVQGRAFVVGRNEILIDPDDPLAGGFLLR